MMINKKIIVVSVLATFLIAIQSADSGIKKYCLEVEKKCQSIQAFLEKHEEKKEINQEEVDILQAHLDNITDQYEQLSEVVYKGCDETIVVNGKNFDVEDFTNEVLEVKGHLEDFMGERGLLPDDYDNGLI